MSTLEEKVQENKRKGSEIIIDVLNEVGVEYIFGHTGGAVIPIHVEMNKRMNRKERIPKFILFRQEHGAGHAAEGYARSSGKTAVAMATSGPGATGLVTSIADAYKDSIPVVFITGQVSSKAIGNDSFQEVDTIGITTPITKHGYLVRDVNDLEGSLRSAFHIASTGRPGPVVVDICKDAMLLREEKKSELPLHPGYNPKKRIEEKQAQMLLEGLQRSERPVILAGGGIVHSGSNGGLMQFAEKYNLPVVLTFMGLGSIPHDSKHFLGMPGMHGTVPANYALKEADFILNIGSRFDDRVLTKDFGRKAKIAHVDIEEAELNKNVVVDYPVLGNALDFLEYANIQPFDGKQNRAWWETIEGWKEQNPLSYEQSRNPVKPQYVIEQISQITDGNATIVTGVGQHQMWTALYYEFKKPRQWISSGGLGTMGFGLPAAIGAHYGNPSKKVICIDGDGSFQMNIQELGTISQNKLPIKIIVMNNGYLGMVRQWEDMFDEGNHYETCLNRTPDCPAECVSNTGECRNLNPDFAKFGLIYPHLRSTRITKTDEVKDVLENAIRDEYPWLIDVWIDKKEDVLPMIPAGGNIEDIIRGGYENATDTRR